MAELQDVTFGIRVAIRKTAHRFSRDFNAMRRRAVRLSGALTFAALTALLLTAPVAGHAAILSVDNAGGYTFTNFDPVLTGTAVGSNVNGISNTGRRSELRSTPPVLPLAPISRVRRSTPTR